MYPYYCWPFLKLVVMWLCELGRQGDITSLVRHYTQYVVSSSYELRLAKTGLKIFLVVIPKERTDYRADLSCLPRLYFYSVLYQKKALLGWCQAFFWYNNDKDLRAHFRTTWLLELITWTSFRRFWNGLDWYISKHNLYRFSSGLWDGKSSFTIVPLYLASGMIRVMR